MLLTFKTATRNKLGKSLVYEFRLSHESVTLNLFLCKQFHLFHLEIRFCGIIKVDSAINIVPVGLCDGKFSGNLAIKAGKINSLDDLMKTERKIGLWNRVWRIYMFRLIPEVLRFFITNVLRHLINATAEVGCR